MLNSETTYNCASQRQLSGGSCLDASARIYRHDNVSVEPWTSMSRSGDHRLFVNIFLNNSLCWILPNHEMIAFGIWAVFYVPSAVNVGCLPSLLVLCKHHDPSVSLVATITLCSLAECPANQAAILAEQNALRSMLMTVTQSNDEQVRCFGLSDEFSSNILCPDVAVSVFAQLLCLFFNCAGDRTCSSRCCCFVKRRWKC